MEINVLIAMGYPTESFSIRRGMIHEWSADNGEKPTQAEYDAFVASDDGQAAIAGIALEIEKENRRTDARCWLLDYEDGIVEINGARWPQDYKSVRMLKAAREIATEGGYASVTLYDDDNIGHDFTLDEAKSLILQLGGMYQMALCQKQAWMRQIEVAATADELPTIP